MEQGIKHSRLLGWGAGWLPPVIGLTLALFLLGQAVTVFKAMPYIGRDVASADTISVSGKGEVFAAPDTAVFSFTVQDTDKVVGTAQDAVTKNMKAVLAFLKQNGVADKDVQTQSYTINPHYDYQNAYCPPVPTPVYNGASGSVSSTIYCPPGKSVLTGYDVTETVQVKVRTLSDAGKLVGGIGGLGATGVSGLTFTIDQESAILRDARQKAIADAKSKADQLASDLGVHLVRIISFNEGGAYPIYYAAKSAMATGMGGGAVPDAAQIPTGQNQYVSNVNITYEIQ